jgi:hypothetical protein
VFSVEQSPLTPAYAATVFDVQRIRQTVILEPAKQSDMNGSWVCDWPNLWKMTDFECEAVIKLSFNGKTKGLMRFGLYPYDGNPSKSPEYLEIRNLEALEGNTREVNPVGFWLIWYAVQVGLFICDGDFKGSVITLDAFEDRRPYYRDKVKMDELGQTRLSPSEDGYAYRFTEEGALAFCSRLESRYGFPDRISP